MLQNLTNIILPDQLTMSQCHSGLQRCIFAVEEYAKSCGLVVSMKRKQDVSFFFPKTELIKYGSLSLFAYDKRNIRYESFYRNLGGEIPREISDNCEFILVKDQGVLKARKTISAIRRALTVSSNVAVDLAMKLSITKVETIPTYGITIW